MSDLSGSVKATVLVCGGILLALAYYVAPYAPLKDKDSLEFRSRVVEAKKYFLVLQRDRKGEALPSHQPEWWLLAFRNDYPHANAISVFRSAAMAAKALQWSYNRWENEQAEIYATYFSVEDLRELQNFDRRTKDRMPLRVFRIGLTFKRYQKDIDAARNASHAELEKRDWLLIAKVNMGMRYAN